MKKRFIVLSVLTIIPLLFLLYIAIINLWVIPRQIATDMWAFKFPDKYLNYEIVKCDAMDFSNPLFVFVDQMPGKPLELMYYSIETKRFLWPLGSTLENSYIGGTDVKNSTYEEVVAMVQEDCAQFQQGHGDYFGDDLTWVYYENEIEPEKTEEELDFDRRYTEWILENHRRAVARGEAEQTEFSSVEEGLRANGYTEDELKELAEIEGWEYVGPQG